MKPAARLAELESLGRPLTPDECREANRLRAKIRSNASRVRRYRHDPAYRQRKIDYSRARNAERRTMEAAE